MKKSLILFGISMMFILSACSSKIEAVPIQVESDQGCYDCNQKPIVACSKEIKVIKYTDRCTNCSTFPVTVRKYSKCNKGEEI